MTRDVLMLELPVGGSGCGSSGTCKHLKQSTSYFDELLYSGAKPFLGDTPDVAIAPLIAGMCLDGQEWCVPQALHFHRQCKSHRALADARPVLVLSVKQADSEDVLPLAWEATDVGITASGEGEGWWTQGWMVCDSYKHTEMLLPVRVSWANAAQT